MGKRYLLIVTGLLLLSWGCRKELTFHPASVDLRFSEDTIFLDTVFTTIGSSTRTLVVKNPTDENLLISNIRLGRGQSSLYRLNVDGASTKNANDVELLANDSMYIFIEVTADVSSQTDPLYLDSIIFNTGGNLQNVQLVTLAQDAHFYYPNQTIEINRDPLPPLIIPVRVLDCNDIWQNDKPHVVYGLAIVDENCSLTIEAGAQVHFHSGSGMFVGSNATLLIDPTNVGDIETNPVLIQGDRLEPLYEEIPGQWGHWLFGGVGIFIGQESFGNTINNCIIKNANIGLRADSTGASNVNLTIKNSIIKNNSRVGLYGGFANIEAENLVLSNNGLYSFFALGGNYQFRHCTFANYWTQSSRNSPSIGLTNFFETPSGDKAIRDLENAYFGNCIVYGNNQSEFGVGALSGGKMNYQFVNGLMRLEKNPEDNSYDVNDPDFFLDCILNQDPNFVDDYGGDYQLDTLSPAINAGNTADGALVPLDILKFVRSGVPDIGAYERQE
jgi:hypothetical protein